MGKFGLALMVALTLCWGVADAAMPGGAGLPDAERNEGFVLSGQLQISSIFRNNMLDFSDERRIGYGEFLNPAAGKAANNTDGLASDNHAYSAFEVTISALFTLTNNVTAAVQLESTNGAAYAGDGGSTAPKTLVSSTSSVGETDLQVEQAYVDVKEFIDRRLSMRIGLQDVVYGLGRPGNDFLLNSSELGNRMVIRNGGNIDYAFSTTARRQAAANGTSAVDDLDTNREAFAYKWTWDQKENDWTLDFIILKLVEGGQSDIDQDIIGAHLTYTPELGLSDKGATFIGHIRQVHMGINSQGGGGDSMTEETDDTLGRGARFTSWGFGADVWVNQDLEVYGELDFQAGDFNEDGTPNSGTNGFEEDLDALAYYIGARYEFPGMDDLDLWVEGQIAYYSGDDSFTDDEEETYINFGDNDMSIVVEENDCGFGLSANYSVIRVMGGVRLDQWLEQAGFSLPGDSLVLTGGFHMFTLAEDTISAANATSGIQHGEDDLGTELDFVLTWTYSERLSFSLAWGQWFPGGFVEENTQLGGHTWENAGDDDTVSIWAFGTSVTF